MSDDSASGPDLAAGVKLSDLPDGTLLGGTHDGVAVVIANYDGRISAFSGNCTHQGAPLKDGLMVDGMLRCPWHHARFCLRTGEAIAAPAFKPLKAYKTEQRDGCIFVRRDEASPMPPKGKDPGRVVIVGGGAAGFACAEMLARSGFSGSVTVISQDGDKPYDRTQCSKQYLAGDAARDDCFLEGSALLKGLVIGKKVVALDLSKREVALGDGERVAFDALVLATGSEPKRPDTPGFDRPNVFVLRTLRDADAIIEAAVAGKKAAIVGASFIGLEVAASLRQRKVEVDVVAPGKIPLGKIVGPEVGEMIRGVHEEKGVRFHLGRKAQSFDGRSLVLDDGSALAVDFVVAGVGVTPNTELAEKAGIKVVPEGEGGGLVVDARLQTSAPGVYAVGDIARYPDRYVGKPIRVEHWVHAERQGQHVARVLMGEAEDYADLPFFWSAHFDTGLVYSGHAEDASPAGLDGKIDKQDFMLRLSDTKGGEAILSCGRDVPALQAEADWEKIGKPPAKP